MSTLDIKKCSKTHLLASLGCILFSAVYEWFAHGVFSNYMIFPGTLLFILGYGVLNAFPKLFNKLSYNLYNSFLATSVIGSYMKGVLDIYGTTNDLIYIYLIISLMFLIMTLITIIWSKVNE